ncbi:Uncharacterized protein GBIM_12631 [Gryllus bimaculatus]|nr:Uncharacterized protein GBIM_12631 [Gryllus bimaculatus]
MSSGFWIFGGLFGGGGGGGLGDSGEREPFACQSCGRRYKYAKNLRRHQRDECGRAPRFGCPLCPHRTKLRFNLNTHMLRKHGAPLPPPAPALAGPRPA